MKNKIRLVIFEGADRTGKTTAKLMFNKKTKFKHLVVDRLFFSNWIYSKSLRDVNCSEYVDLCKQINSEVPILFVLVRRSKISSSTYKHDQFIFELFWKDWLQMTSTAGYVINNDGTLKDLSRSISTMVKNLGL